MMAFKCMMIVISLLILEITHAAAQDRQTGLMGSRIPILYEAYYPESSKLPTSRIVRPSKSILKWSARANLDEIKKLRELTSRLLREEEELGQLAKRVVATESANVFQPQSQVLEYVFSGYPQMSKLRPLPAVSDDVLITSLTVSDTSKHRIRHHHGQNNWRLRRTAPIN
ncbi:PREDICTED: uncharacterized protein LOC105360923 [Ceratosolen solmsi marchali]|uniref:Uncharacterized protein LOC105360923 n=1 Tax=Ceratosolen solmsi marchali TaxID=326594 RepID=A0AAJ6YDU9_9HYME|nr:PREDICTED: uncharacterized protein LOC105360923 [Ceratosolen solmsi marchali]